MNKRMAKANEELSVLNNSKEEIEKKNISTLTWKKSSPRTPLVELERDTASPHSRYFRLFSLLSVVFMGVSIFAF